MRRIAPRGHVRRRLAAVPVAALIVVGSLLTSAPPAWALVPFTCSIGDLVPTEIEVGAEASWSRQLIAGTPAILSLDVDLGSGLAELSNLTGDIRELTFSLADPALEFTGGDAQLGSGTGRGRADVTVRDEGVVISFAGPFAVSRDVPLPRMTAELDVIPTFPGRVAVDSGDLAISFVLFASGIVDQFDTECAASTEQELVVTSVSPPTSSTQPGRPEPNEEDEEVDRPETLPTTGPSTIVWASVAAGLIALDLGWAAWSLVGHRRSRRSLDGFLRGRRR